ncbi:DUF2514 family protein [Pseudorhodoferax sp. Leaf265]|uniref:DUF2514 family protein n=1 Tax=Pseudorhodoferax sp. Leaf265 TaxID=1736315 RepID=UPI0006FF51FA|nr:DUF2514 family protein [Pseudorhodoferax sp. Leaf265]KQP02441.1 hypothetical protein ASF45_20520 [Pseudorhodoferax sp. Leaf265]
MNWVRIAAWAGLAALVLAGLHWWTSSIEARGYDRGRNDAMAKWAQADLARARATLRQSEVNREEETRREAAKQKEIDHAQEQRRAAVAAAARADRAADGLRGQLATFLADARSRARVPADPGTAGGSPPVGGDLDLLAELYRGADARAGELAKALDVSRAAGHTCERLYDALTAHGR